MTTTVHRFTRIENCCPACFNNTSLEQIGIDCGNCNHHFHIGGELLLSTIDLPCPRCEAVCSAMKIEDIPPQKEPW